MPALPLMAETLRAKEREDDDGWVRSDGRRRDRLPGVARSPGLGGRRQHQANDVAILAGGRPGVAGRAAGPGGALRWRVPEAARGPAVRGGSSRVAIPHDPTSRGLREP